jgi:hypothetical protein
MHKKVRDLILTPLVEGSLSQIIPDFTMNLSDGPVTAPAQLSARNGKFRFAIHFMDGLPPLTLLNSKKTTFTAENTFIVSGQVVGELAFECCDVYPSFNTTTRSRGTSTLFLESKKMHLPAEGADAMCSSEVSEWLGKPLPVEEERPPKCRSHSIFHGPQLLIMNGTSETVQKNDFLGEASNSSLDTHVFKGAGYEGAVIQSGRELHLHLRSSEPHKWNSESWGSLVESIEQAVGFTHGFQPWPVYREARIDHRIIERWIACHQALGQTSFAPISRALWANVSGFDGDPLHQIIPTIAQGLGSLTPTMREGIKKLLWQFRATELSDLPPTTKLLMACSILDGMIKVLAGKADPKDKSPTKKTWKEAWCAAGLNWENWGSPLFELWGKHRHHLAHGWLWHSSFEEPSAYFTDYPQLCGGLNILVAAACGYDGKILTNAYRSQVVEIQSLRLAR